MTIGDWIGEHWDKFKNGLTGFSRVQGDYAHDLYNIAFSDGDESVKDRAINAWNATLDLGQNQAANFGGVASPVFDLPLIKQGGAFLTWLQKTAVNRPAATALLAVSDSSPLGMTDIPTDLGTFFSPDTWQKAWNDSRKVTAGQALTYNTMVGLGEVEPGDPNYDPRKSKEAYYQDWFYRTTSGSTDFILALADPLRGVSKLARLTKLRTIDKAPTARQIQKGALEQQTFGNKSATLGTTFQDAGGQLAPGVEKLYQAAQEMDPATFTKLYWTQHTYGGVVGTGLSTAAKLGDRELFGDILMSARGSTVATQRVVQSPSGAAWAEALGRQRNPFNVANITEKQADDQLAWEQADAIRESGEAAVMDQVTLSSPRGTPEFGTLQGTEGALTDKRLPRVRPRWDGIKIGIHQFGSSSYTPLQVAPLYERVIARGLGNVVRIVSPGRGYASHVLVNEVGSFRQFRANLERAGDLVDDETRNAYMTAYMAALTANERARIAGAADNHIIGVIAEKHGLTKAEAQRLIMEASLRRHSFRQMLSTQERFLPSAFKKRADKLLKDGARAEAARYQEYAERYRQGAQSLTIPDTEFYFHTVDEMGRPLWVVNNDWQNPLTVDRWGRMAAVPKLDQSEPLLTSQQADRLPMVDYQAFERALTRFADPRKTIERYESDQARIAAGEEAQYGISAMDYGKARAAKAAQDARGAFQDVYEVFNHVWSVAAVLRPAQTLRTLADDGTRSLTMIGVLPTLLSGTRGLGRIAYNLTRHGTTWAQERGYLRARRAMENRSHDVVQVDDIGDSAISREAPSESAGAYNYIDPRGTSGALTIGADEVYPTIEAALIAGRIDLNTYMAYLPWAARQGRVPYEISAILQEWAMGFYGKGVQGRRGLKREVLEYVADTMGGAAYTFPRWQQDAMDAINEMAASNRRFRENHGIIMNPLADDARHLLDRKADEDYEFVAHGFLVRNPDTFDLEDGDGLYEFVSDHAEKFLAGGYKLHAKVMSDGRIRLSVVRPRKMPRPVVERMTEAQRKAVLKGLKGPGSSGVRLVDGTRTVTIPGVFAGMDGDFAKSAVSAEYIPRGMRKGQRNADRAAQWNARISRHDASPWLEDAEGKRYPNPDWDGSWEQTVNNQLANDDAARMFLEGRSEAQVLEWLESAEPSALRYLNDRAKLGLTIDRHVSVVRALVDYMSPPEAGQAVRDSILRHEAKGAELKAATPENLWPDVVGETVHTSLGTHPAMLWAQRRLDGWFRVMQDKPADFLVRYPFIENKYKSYFEPMYANYVAQTPGHLVTQEAIDRIARMARQKAIDDTKRYLYDQTFRTDLANALSPLMPFSNAIADSLFKWLKIARERPLDAAANWNLIYNFPERNGLVYDQDGNSLSYEDGKEVWRSKLDGSVMPGDVKHDKYVAFQPPSWIADKIPGGLKLVQFNKNSMTSAIFDPSINVGPLVAFPVNEFALYKPEVGENQFVKTYVLPFGPTSQESRMLLPGLIGAANRFFREDESKASSAAMAIYQTQMTDYMLGKRDTVPDLEAAKEQARSEQWLRFATSAGSPISFQYNSPYQPYIDLYSQLLRKYSGDDSKAMEEFRTVAGDEYVYLAARVTKANIALPSTVEGYRAFQAKRDAILRYPELSSLITGEEGAGSFSKSVYEWEKQQTYDESGKPIREEMTIKDSVKDLERRTGWSDWVKYMADIQNDLSRRGLTSINQAGAEDIKQRYQFWITARRFRTGPNQEFEVSSWYDDFRSTDGAKMENRLAQMQGLLMEHPDWVASRPEFQGLAQYLDMRHEMKIRMEYLGFASLGSQKAQWLQDVWDAQIFTLRQRNTAFDQLFSRWLVKDDLSAYGVTADEVVQGLEGAYGPSEQSVK